MELGMYQNPNMEDWEKKVFELYTEEEGTVWTIFKVYKYRKWYIVHGEINIICYDEDFNKLWSYSGGDIFVSQDETDAFRIYGRGIWLKDFSGCTYLINFDGKCIYNCRPVGGKSHDGMLNTMCFNCAKLSFGCEGTTNHTWDGCVDKVRKIANSD